jgi:hypothetical protein
VQQTDGEQFFLELSEKKEWEIRRKRKFFLNRLRKKNGKTDGKAFFPQTV